MSIKKENKRIMITFNKDSINNLNKLKEIFNTKQNSVVINKLLTEMYFLWEKKKIQLK